MNWVSILLLICCLTSSLKSISQQSLQNDSLVFQSCAKYLYLLKKFNGKNEINNEIAMLSYSYDTLTKKTKISLRQVIERKDLKCDSLYLFNVEKYAFTLCNDSSSSYKGSLFRKASIFEKHLLRNYLVPQDPDYHFHHDPFIYTITISGDSKEEFLYSTWDKSNEYIKKAVLDFSWLE